MFAQDRVHVEHYTRQPGGNWNLQEASDRTDAISIASIKCEIKLADAYLDIAFDAPVAPLHT